MHNLSREVVQSLLETGLIRKKRSCSRDSSAKWLFELCETCADSMVQRWYLRIQHHMSEIIHLPGVLNRLGEHPDWLQPKCVGDICKKEDREPRQVNMHPIFNPDKKRRVGTAGCFGQKVALWTHRYLREEACILDAYAHAVDLINHKDKMASFLWSSAGCREQTPHADFRPWGCRIQNSRSKPLSCIFFLKKKRRQIPLGHESRFGGKMMQAPQLLKS